MMKRGMELKMRRGRRRREEEDTRGVVLSLPIDDNKGVGESEAFVEATVGEGEGEDGAGLVLGAWQAADPAHDAL